jgi:uridylate kinase
VAPDFNGRRELPTAPEVLGLRSLGPASKIATITGRRCRRFGARNVIPIKDVDGLYTDDPKLDPATKLIPQISVAELLARRPRTLPVDPVILDLLIRAKTMTSVRIINGLIPGNGHLRREAVGTVIHSA